MATNRLSRSFSKLFGASVISNLGDGVGTIAYPWLASAVTREPLLIAAVTIAQRLPWLLFTLPAGVLTDRLDRRRVMVTMDILRAALTAAVALAVVAARGQLPAPDALDTVTGTNVSLYVVVVTATLLLGSAEVLRDNCAQTILPDIVSADQLERANGRQWSGELVANTFAGPPLGSILLSIAFFVPFFVDAGTFFAAAALVFLIPGTFQANRDDDETARSFRSDLADGVRWLMGHSLLRPMAIILGIMNAAGTVSAATFVLFAQEALGVGPVLFAVIGFGGAIGGILGGQLASRISARLGSGTSLALALGGGAVIPFVIGATSWWWVVLILFAVQSFLAVLWNVITVSLRQSIIPGRLLGRVNSVYRFFAWGMMPIGAAIGGFVVWAVERLADRDLAVRSTWYAAGLINLAVFVVGRSKLTTAKIEVARAAAS